MEFSNFVMWAFGSLLTGSVLYGVKLLSKMQDDLSQLNIKIAVIIEKHDNQDLKLAAQQAEIKEINARLSTVELTLYKDFNAD